MENGHKIKYLSHEDTRGKEHTGGHDTCDLPLEQNEPNADEPAALSGQEERPQSRQLCPRGTVGHKGLRGSDQACDQGDADQELVALDVHLVTAVEVPEEHRRLKEEGRRRAEE